MGLAASGGTAVVQAMATDSWESLRSAFARLFRRLGDRHADTIAAKLDEDSARLADGAAEPAELEGEWRTRLADLLSTYPEAADDLRAVIELATQPVTAHAAIADSARAEIEDSADNTLGRGQSAATITNSPDAKIRRSGNIG